MDEFYPRVSGLTWLGEMHYGSSGKGKGMFLHRLDLGIILF